MHEAGFSPRALKTERRGLNVGRFSGRHSHRHSHSSRCGGGLGRLDPPDADEDMLVFGANGISAAGLLVSVFPAHDLNRWSVQRRDFWIGLKVFGDLSRLVFEPLVSIQVLVVRSASDQNVQLLCRDV